MKNDKVALAAYANQTSDDSVIDLLRSATKDKHAATVKFYVY